MPDIENGKKCNFVFGQGIIEFLDKLNVDLYKSYLVHITEIIKERTKYLNNK